MKNMKLPKLIKKIVSLFYIFCFCIFEGNHLANKLQTTTTYQIVK